MKQALLASALLAATVVLSVTGQAQAQPTSASPRSGAERSVASTSPAAAPALTVSLLTDVRNAKQPYAPYNSVGRGDNQGGRDCQLYYHEYLVTEGCGGAWLTAELRGFSKLPNGSRISGLGRMSADFGRTFGCLVNGKFLTKMVLRENDVAVPAVYLSAYFGPGAVDGTQLKFFRNFQPVDFVCTAGTRAQLGLRVSDVRVTITSDQLATVRRTFAGPFYSPAG